jgi:endonuclease/exonuclease/phosphatase family metal-dependent hydrolase
MEIITYNVQSPFLGISNYEERLDLIINKIAQYNATIILFQEVFIMSLFTMKIFSKDNYIKSSLQNIGYSYFAQSTSTANMQNSGLFIAGHYPIEIIDEIAYPQHEEDERFTTKGAIIFRIDHPEYNKLTIINTHLHCMNYIDEYSQIRMEQLQQIKDTLIKHNIFDNIVICGDLNIDSINEPTYKYYEKLMELFPDGKDSFAPPFPITNPPDARIDYIVYYGKDFEFDNTRIVNANSDSLEASDHLGIKTQLFTIKNEI